MKTGKEQKAAVTRHDGPHAGPDPAIVFMGILAITVLQTYRASFHHWIPWLFFETSCFLVVPFFIASACTRAMQNSGAFFRNRSALIFTVICAAILVLTFQFWSRSYDLGDSNEIIVMLVIQNLGWVLAIFSCVTRLGRYSMAAFNSLVLFVCFIAENNSTYWMAGIFWVASLWWLISSYWGQLEKHQITSTSRLLPVKTFAFSGVLILVSLVTLGCSYCVPGPVFRSLFALIPFSGGERGTESRYARSGVGSGQQLTSGENASVAGAINSDTFFEDGKMSLYDILMEKFDGPITTKDKKYSRSISLLAQAKHLHNIQQQERGGKTFRTARQLRSPLSEQAETQRTQSLFFVDGPLPIRLTQDCFYHFDGLDWTNSEIDTSDTEEQRKLLPPISIENVDSKPWFVFADDSQDLGITRFHEIKIMRIQTPKLPAPSLLQGWHIDRAKQKNLFEWSADGVIQFTGEFFPEHTVIRLASIVPFESRLDSKEAVWHIQDFFPDIANAKNSAFHKMLLNVPCNGSRERIQLYLDEILADEPRGWSQISKLICRLRQDFELDEEWVARIGPKDSVSQFLDNGGGPSYLFATVAVQMLRQAGYPTRLTRGFLVRPKDYQAARGQSAVTADNLHFWPEVCLDGKHWIAVEPTPGLPQPSRRRGFWRHLSSVVLSIASWVNRNPVSTSLLLAGLISVIKYWKSFLNLTAFLTWVSICAINPQKALSATRHLIDFRFRMAGLPRPKHRTVKDWFTQIPGTGNQTFFDYWHAQNYMQNGPVTDSRLTIQRACREIVKVLNFADIHDFTLSYLNCEFQSLTPPPKNRKSLPND